MTAVCVFAGGPGREREAAEAWAFELTYYFRRGVGEAPRVTYADGVYTCAGLMTTTFPWDTGPVVRFDPGAEPWSLDFCADPRRRRRLLAQYPGSVKWDGRPAAAPPLPGPGAPCNADLDPQPSVRKTVTG